MDTKICPRPGCEFSQSPQPITNFHRNRRTSDGVACYCKSCQALLHVKRMESQEARDKANETAAKYRASDHGREAIKAYRESPERREGRRAYIREYRKRPDVRLKSALECAAYRTRNALKQRGREIYTLALKSGKIVKPDHCEWCKKPAQPKELQAHHWRGYDPDHWLDVKHVHRTCHLKCETVKPEDWP